VDTGLVDVRDLMLEQAVKLCQSSVAEEIELEPAHRNLLEERMSAVLLAPAGAHFPRKDTSLGAAGREDWNRLLYTFYTQQDEAVSPCVF
jgi:hypothetical protein